METYLYILLIVVLAMALVIAYLMIKLYRTKISQGDHASGIFITLNTFREIERDVEELFDKTHASRLLILTANQGIESGTQVTAIYEHNLKEKAQVSVGATGRYVNLDVDKHYEAMLRKIEQFEFELFWTETMQPSLLQDIYRSEKVICSYVIMIGKYPIDETKDRVLYCSIATHNPLGFETDNEKEFVELARKIKLKIDEVNDKVNEFKISND